MDARDPEQGERVESLDDVDGILKNMFSRGKYRPKQHEKESWGPAGPAGDETVPEVEECMIGMLFRIKPEWRQGLVMMLTDPKSEEHVRKCMVFLHTLVKRAIDIMEVTEDAVGKSVPFEENSAPKHMNISDWTSVMSGLKFKMESPGTVRKIDFVDVAIDTHTNKDVLMGICHFLQCMMGLPWTNLKIMLNMDPGEGKTAFTTVAMLDAGYGISDEVKAPMVKLDSKYPSLFKSLGFRKGGNNRLQWQKPFDSKEYDLLLGALHGLFRSVEETIL